MRVLIVLLVACVCAIFSQNAPAQSAVACAVGYRVESAPTQTSSVWAFETTLPSTATSLTIAPTTTKWFRILLLMSDGSTITAPPIKVTVKPNPKPPMIVDLKTLFKGHNYGTL